MDKPPRTFWQIWNMSFGFLGIQFGWGLQMANMSAIYEYLGAMPVAPDSVAGGARSRADRPAADRTMPAIDVGSAGPRRPFFLAGAILDFACAHPDAPNSRSGWRPACFGFSMPPSTSAWNRSAPLLADILPESQRSRGFAMQSLFIGLGRVAASALPYLLTNAFHR